MKITYFYKNIQELSLDFVKKKYELNFEDKLKQLTDSILQYPETSNDKQLENMFIKMQIYIITNYQLGSPKNHVLLKQCRQSLNSVLGKGDIQKYVLRKKYHRLEYLQKLGATVAGILIFNNQGSQGDKENMRNIFADLKMAISNTKESLEDGIDRAHFLKQKAMEVVQELFKIDVQQEIIYYLRPCHRLHEINQFVVFFEIYRMNLEKALDAFEKTQYLIDVGEKKFYCVIEKINETLKYRSAIESELIFPHFVYLSELWTSLNLYLNHLVEINRIKDKLDDIFNEQLENKFYQLFEELNEKSNILKNPIIQTVQDSLNNNNILIKENMLNIKPFLKDYCVLTMALTGGLLIPSQLEKKLCEDQNLLFGFANIEFAKFVEHNFKDFIQIFRKTILTNINLVLLFQLDDNVLQQDFDLIYQTKAKTNTIETQTDIHLNNENLPSNYKNLSWNIWDFHRATIKLANIRKKQTHSSQSKLTYGLRNSQNQTDIKLNK
ncbi:cilia- and flagella-associated protein 206 isoform 2-T2 [Cochliomyia hominivorax]